MVAGVLMYSSIPNICEPVVKPIESSLRLPGFPPTTIDVLVGYHCLGLGPLTQGEWASGLGGIVGVAVLVGTAVYKSRHS